ncbi:HGGxSTG domain-containing protein [Roseibium aggregatum]|uniref:HGGxSTG domain-containing protein n=1 Tax=Roseibium aggregatum TaxID=187304 RepID=UPI00278C511A|nr:HGGxSTG domain-containing protein [Roseibium aggregatum]
MHSAPRCAARSKRTGKPCRNPAVNGWSVCRMHGARGGSMSGKDCPAYKHGGRTKEAEQLRKLSNDLTRLMRDFGR